MSTVGAAVVMGVGAAVVVVGVGAAVVVVGVVGAGQVHFPCVPHVGVGNLSPEANAAN
jgi:hypothetical protein